MDPTNNQALVEVKKALPAELMNRFDAFLVRMNDLVPDSEKSLEAAREFVVDSEAAMQVADVALVESKMACKSIITERLDLTRPIDDFKNSFLEAARPIIENETEAQQIYTTKMSAYRRQKQEEARKAQLEAERQLAEQRRKEEEAARKLREKAARLKSDEAKQRALAEAETREQAAQMMPTSVALSSAQPQTVASNVAEIHEVEKIEDMSAYLRWLADHPEWHCVLNFKVSEHNRLAKQFHSIGVPGLKFHTKDSFRTKAR